MLKVHESNLIHRDLKPQNILIDNMKHVKLSDFGIACYIDVETQTRTTNIGTLKYMAPELLRESTNYDQKVDIYSFGVVMFYILTNGNLPNISIIDAGNGKKAEIPKNVNEISKNLINMCWSTEPENRPTFKYIVDYIQINDFNLIEGVKKYLPQIQEFLSIE